MTSTTAKLRRKNLIKKVVFYSLLAAVLLTPVVTTTVFYLNATHAFRTEPKVEIKAKNTFDTTLKAATDESYEPFSYIIDGEYTGLDVELIAETANRMEMNLDLTLMDWTLAKSKLLEGEFDVIINMELENVTPETGMIATIPTDEKQYVIYGREKVVNLGGLYNKKIAAYKDFPSLGLDLEVCTNYTDIFTMLRDKKIDFAICPIQVGDHFVKTVGCTDVFASYVVGYSYGCLALKQGNEALRDRLNDVIKSMQADGTISRLDQKWIIYRSGDQSFFVMLEENPYLIVLLGASLLLAAMLVVFSIFESKNGQKELAYAAELENNLELLHQQNEELDRTRIAAEAANKAKTAFLFNMSHDIRTPMNAIIGYTDLAQKHIDEKDRVLGYLKSVESSSRHLLHLVNNILEMSRIESNKVELQLDSRDLVKLLGESASMLEFDAKSQKKELTYIHEVVHPYVYCDELRVKQIVLNLLSNAVKFTSEGGHISLSIMEEAETPGRYVVRVKDDGIGMSEEFQRDIYKPFERERNSTVSGIQGTGLGMSIVLRLVEMMNGTINCISAPGKGTTFTIAVPFKLSDEPAVETEEEKPQISEKKTAKDARILIVDDNEINRIILSEILIDEGYEVDFACDGKEAVDRIQKAKKGDFDIIFMDVQMPLMDGYEATQFIRASGCPLANIPIIAVTANAFEEDKADALKAGMNGHLSKPVNPADVFATLDTMLK